MGSGGQEVGRGRGQAEMDGDGGSTSGGAACRGEKNKIKCVDCCLFRKNNFASFMSAFPLLETDQIYRVLRIYAALLQTPSVSSVCVCLNASLERERGD